MADLIGKFKSLFRRSRHPAGTNLQAFIVLVGILILLVLTNRQIKIALSTVELQHLSHVWAIPIVFMLLVIIARLFHPHEDTGRALLCLMFWGFFLLFLDIYLKAIPNVEMERLMLLSFVVALLWFAVFWPELPMLSACLVSVAVLYQKLKDIRDQPFDYKTMSETEFYLGLILLFAPVWMQFYIKIKQIVAHNAAVAEQTK
ncbi:MAG: hypothetical protein ACLQPD_06510 [Desulfomonilaceae bacterium]